MQQHHHMISPLWHWYAVLWIKTILLCSISSNCITIFEKKLLPSLSVSSSQTSVCCWKSSISAMKCPLRFAELCAATKQTFLSVIPNRCSKRHTVAGDILTKVVCSILEQISFSCKVGCSKTSPIMKSSCVSSRKWTCLLSRDWDSLDGPMSPVTSNCFKIFPTVPKPMQRILEILQATLLSFANHRSKLLYVWVHTTFCVCCNFALDDAWVWLRNTALFQVKCTLLYLSRLLHPGFRDPCMSWNALCILVYWHAHVHDLQLHALNSEQQGWLELVVSAVIFIDEDR